MPHEQSNNPKTSPKMGDRLLFTLQVCKLKTKNSVFAIGNLFNGKLKNTQQTSHRDRHLIY